MSSVLNCACVNISLQGDYKFVNGMINYKQFHVAALSIVKENCREPLLGCKLYVSLTAMF